MNYIFGRVNKELAIRHYVNDEAYRKIFDFRSKDNKVGIETLTGIESAFIES